MKITSISTMLLAAMLAANASAQDEQKPPAKKEATKEASPLSTKELVQRLGDSDYQVRRKAEADLRSRGKEAVPDLEKAAESSSDEEIRWRARQLVRQLKDGGDGGALRRRPERSEQDPKRSEQDPSTPLPPAPRVRAWTFPGGGQDLDDAFNQMFERMERQFGIDIPRQRFFHDDFFKDLERQMDDITRQGGGAQGHSLQMQVGPDGVKVQIQEKGADGKTETKSYEAPDMDAFRAKYPDIAKQYFDGGRGNLRMQLGAPRLRLWQGQPTPLLPVEPDVIDQPLDKSSFDALPAGERLGVTIEPIDEQLRDDLGLEDGQGMRVRDVLDGSLAEKLGIKTGDILTTVAGKPIHEAGEVREILRGVAAGSKVTAEVRRKGKPLTLEAEKSAEAKKDAPESKKELKKRKPEIR